MNFGRVDLLSEIILVDGDVSHAYILVSGDLPSGMNLLKDDSFHDISLCEPATDATYIGKPGKTVSDYHDIR